MGGFQMPLITAIWSLADPQATAASETGIGGGKRRVRGRREVPPSDRVLRSSLLKVPKKRPCLGCSYSCERKARRRGARCRSSRQFSVEVCVTRL